MAWINIKIVRKTAAILIIDKNEWEELQPYRHQPKSIVISFGSIPKIFFKGQNQIITKIED